MLTATLGIVYPVGYYVPRQLSILSEGQFAMPVPLTLAATAPNLSWAVVNSRAQVHFSSTRASGTASFRFDWSLAEPASLPVQFVISIPDWQSGYYGALAGGSFEYAPAGACTGGCSAEAYDIAATFPGTILALGAFWTFNYTVRLMSRLEGIGTARFLEVDLSPASLEGTGVYHMADLGIANATPSQLQLLQSFNTQSGPLFGFSTNASAFQGRTFGYTPAAVAIDAGTQGTLTLRLTSSFRWSSLLWEAVSFTGSGGNFSVQEFMDLRFGSILLTVGPWSGV